MYTITHKPCLKPQRPNKYKTATLNSNLSTLDGIRFQIFTFTCPSSRRERRVQQK